jgi:hypothetical protein
VCGLRYYSKTVRAFKLNSLEDRCRLSFYILSWLLGARTSDKKRLTMAQWLIFPMRSSSTNPTSLSLDILYLFAVCHHRRHRCGFVGFIYLFIFFFPFFFVLTFNPQCRQVIVR